MGVASGQYDVRPGKGTSTDGGNRQSQPTHRSPEACRDPVVRMGVSPKGRLFHGVRVNDGPKTRLEGRTDVS